MIRQRGSIVPADGKETAAALAAAILASQTDTATQDPRETGEKHDERESAKEPRPGIHSNKKGRRKPGRAIGEDPGDEADQTVSKR